jgi:hypothetical protein
MIPPLMMLMLLAAGCGSADPVAKERIVERDQLRREVAGYKSLQKLAPGKVVDREHEVLVSVTDTLLRSLLDASFPLTVALRNRANITLTSAQVTFRANVARVDISGLVRRTTYPHIAATVKLRGALDNFAVGKGNGLTTRISIDDVEVDTPTGALAALDPLVIAILRSVVERSLPELTSGLPVVSIPVRIDQKMNLPGFGPEGMLSIEPSSAPMSVEASRVIAFQNRLWIILHVELGSFATVPRELKP